MQLGDWQLDTASGGRLRIDGGTMFGVVPKVLWRQYQPADEQNRIRSATNCVVARRDDRTVLVDTGYGGRYDEREMRFFDLEPGSPIETSLEALGVQRDSIDIVVLSHLHFDHAGGATRMDDRGANVPTFPRAKYVVQRAEWEDALSDAAVLRAAYNPQRLLPLEASGRLQLIEGDVEIFPGLRVIATGGHTRGHQAVVFDSRSESAIYMGDVCPMAAHLRSHWCLSYDTYPLDTRRRKPELLATAAEQNQWVLWDHDPDVVASRVARDPRRDFVAITSLPRL